MNKLVNEIRKITMAPLIDCIKACQLIEKGEKTFEEAILEMKPTIRKVNDKSPLKYGFCWKSGKRIITFCTSDNKVVENDTFLYHFKKLFSDEIKEENFNYLSGIFGQRVVMKENIILPEGSFVEIFHPEGSFPRHALFIKDSGKDLTSFAMQLFSCEKPEEVKEIMKAYEISEIELFISNGVRIC